MFAWGEFKSLVSSLNYPDPSSEGNLRYISSLVSELSYYHIPELEYENGGRAKIVPCSGYQLLYSFGLPTSIENLGTLSGGEIELFAVSTSRVVAVIIKINKDIFIGFRGTSSFYDLKIDLTAFLVPFDFGRVFASSSAHSLLENLRLTIEKHLTNVGMYHRGFLEEAIRICVLIKNHLPGDLRNVFLCGHSLGGAIAVLSQNILWNVGDTVRTTVFGCPRYGNLSAIYKQLSHPPVEIRKSEDFVPLLPPRSLGYVDGALAYRPDGGSISSTGDGARLSFTKWTSSRLLGRFIESHSMEGYRRAVGRACMAKGYNRPLIDTDLLWES